MSSDHHQDDFVFDNPLSEIDYLLAVLRDRNLDDAEVARLDELVAASQENSDYYVSRMFLAASLEWDHQPGTGSQEQQSPAATSVQALTLSGEQSSNVTTPRPSTPHSSRRNRRDLSIGIVAGFAFLAGLLGWAAFTYLPDFARNNDKPAVKNEDKVIAWLVNTHNVEWSEGGVPESTQYKPGQRLEIEQGLVEIQYATGARVVIEGPAEFVVGGIEAEGGKDGNRHKGTKAQSDGKSARSSSPHPSHLNPQPFSNSSFLKLGRLVVRCDTTESQGFIVGTPSGWVEDLGTEFGVEVNQHGTARVVVVSGEVEVVRAASDYGTERRVRLTQGQGALVATRSATIELQEDADEKFVAAIRARNEYAARVAARRERATQVYFEEFTNDTGTGSSNDLSMGHVGWSALLTERDQIVGYSQTGADIAVGVSASGSHGFFAPQTDDDVANDPGLIMTTEPGALDIARLTSVTWDASADNADDQYRLAIRIGSVWYASDPPLNDGQIDGGPTGSYVRMAFNPASFATAANWRVIKNANVGAAEPLSLGAAPIADLSGDISAFGLYLYSGTNDEPGDHIRFDDFKIYAIGIGDLDPTSDETNIPSTTN
ncbi:MAG: FecR domain-containing protein [Pirellulales bacterium]|nr:FecR domain-containing protein [Pirellulales bacterium]